MLQPILKKRYIITKTYLSPTEAGHCIKSIEGVHEPLRLRFLVMSHVFIFSRIMFLTGDMRPQNNVGWIFFSLHFSTNVDLRKEPIGFYQNE